MTATEVTAVVTTHDAGDALLARILALVACPQIARVVIVDSGSTDSSLDRIPIEAPSVVIERLLENRGPCATRNLGLAMAETPYVLLVDDDMGLSSSCVGLLVAELDARPEVVAVGPRICHDEGGAVQYEGGLWHYAGQPHLLRLEGDEVRSVDVLTSGCLLVRKDPVLSAGGFFEPLYFLMEDVELCLRLRLLGHQLLVVPKAVAWNVGGSAGLSLKGKDYPKRRTHLHARNRLMVLLMIYRVRTLLLIWPGLLLMDLSWLAFAAASKTLPAFFRGRLELFGLLKEIGIARRRFQATRVLPDRVVFGTPPLSFTDTALRQPLVSLFARVLDGSLRFLGIAMRGLLS